jgi:prepilin-type N-terminal cleavage/methylation domain-containing protein
MKRGFTFVEIITVVTVVSVVGAIGVALVRTSGSSGPGGGAAQQAKDLLLGVRDQAVATMQCRLVEQVTPGGSNLALNVYHDVDCNPGNTTSDVLLTTVSFDPATVSSVEIVDNGSFDDEKIQYKTDGSLFDTETTRLDITDTSGQHELNIQLATGGVVIQ